MAGFRDKLARHFLNQAEVWGGCDLSLDAPHVYTLQHPVTVHSLCPRMAPLTTSSLKTRGRLQLPNSRGFRFSIVSVKAKGTRVRRYSSRELRVYSASLKKKYTLKVRNGLSQMLEFPQERTNRLKWQTFRPNEPGEVTLAWYGPLIEDAVIKLALEKGRGTLLVWYNSQSKQFKTGGLYLCRRLGVGEKPEWRWV
ncbi:MAG: hypothetical protein K6E38_05685 [Fretibacterium sp.]|nr:hypothetical protein [Fretibacterium sp.]